MAGEWPMVRLGDYVDSNLGKMLDAQKNKGVPRPYLGNSNVRWGSFDLNDLALMKFQEGEEERYGIRDGDLIVCEGGEPGRCAIWREQVPDMKIQKALHRIRPKDGLDNYYLFYWFMLAGRAGRLEPFFTGTTIKHLTGKALNELKVPLPPLPEQRAIAHILGTLDDKIELNRRMSETLEAMARALFKSWFVYFDPVRAKAEGRDPGLPKPLAGLFPARLVDSELGEIPEGWEVTTIGAAVEVIDCLHSRKPERRDSGLPLLQLANIRDDGLLDMEDTYLIDEADYDKWISRMEASTGDCVITNVGRVGAVSQVPVGQRAALGRNMTGVRCRGDFPYPTVLLECLLSRAMKDEVALKMDTGTILDALNVRNIPRLRFVRGTREALDVFERLCRPFRRRMEALLGESRTLAALRDALLPKLILGELRVLASLGSKHEVRR